MINFFYKAFCSLYSFLAGKLEEIFFKSKNLDDKFNNLNKYGFHKLKINKKLDIDKKSLQETAKELDSLAEKARNKALAVADIQGASFTLSNLGGLGASHFTPIVNDPEVAILGTGRAMPRVILDEKRHV